MTPTVLLIDDNPDDRALVERELKQVIDGVRVIHISDAQELAVRLDQGGFDVAITDYRLRWTTGTEVLEMLKERFPEKPVIMFTGSGNEEIAVQAMKEGLDDYITKTVKHYPRVPYAVLACFDRATKREQLQQALERESLAKMRLEVALESANMGTLQVDLETNSVAYSDAIGPMFGQPAGYVHAHFDDWLNDIHPDDRAQVRAAWDAALSGDQYYAAEFRAMGADGKVRWIASSGKVVRNAEGVPRLVIGTARDVTEAVTARENVRRQREELQTMLDVLPVGVAITRDRAADLISLTPYCAKMLGVEESRADALRFADLQELPFRFFRHGAEVGEADMPLQRVVRTGLEVRGEELEIRLANGTVLNLLVNAAPLLDTDGQVRGAVGALVDVTFLKKIQQELERSDRQKNEFLSVLAHELRNPMAAIGYAAELLQHMTSAEGIARIRNVIERQTKHMGKLLDELLDLSRITRNQFELEPRPLDLRRVIEHGLESARPLIEECKHHLLIDLPETPIHVLGDEVRLTQVFSNILNNAAKFTPVEGRIQVRAQEVGSKAVVEVIDNGVGIAPDQLEYVFEMFSQVQPKVSGGTSGLGVGLAIVRKLVELHGGSVKAFSEGKGKGSRLRIELPVLAQPETAPAPVEPREETVQAKVRLLVADDNRDAADSLADVLSFFGYTIQTAYNGREAMELAQSFRPEVAILDIGMPYANGYEVAHWMRTQEWGRHVILIAVTGWGQAEDRNATVEAGFDAHLVKPVSVDDITGTVSALMHKER